MHITNHFCWVQLITFLAATLLLPLPNNSVPVLSHSRSLTHSRVRPFLQKAVYGKARGSFWKGTLAGGSDFYLCERKQQSHGPASTALLKMIA